MLYTQITTTYSCTYWYSKVTLLSFLFVGINKLNSKKYPNSQMQFNFMSNMCFNKTDIIGLNSINLNACHQIELDTNIKYIPDFWSIPKFTIVEISVV